MRTSLGLAVAGLLWLSACGGPANDPGDDSPTPEASAPSSPPMERSGAGPKSPSRSGADESANPATPGGRSAHVAEEGRRWTGRDGELLAIGELIDLLDGRVCLQAGDGRGITVPLEQLCDADRQYVVEQLGETAGVPAVADEPRQAAAAVPSDVPAPGPSAGHSPGRETPPGPIPRSEWVVIPFDFQSEFDDGRYGRMVAEMIWKKLQRQGGFIIPESMLDVRDTCQSNKIRLKPESALAEVKKHVRDDFGAHVGIWGSVQRAPGHDWEVYDLTIKCVDFSAYPEPKVIYEKTARTRSVSEIPRLYVQQMLDAMYQRPPHEPPPPDPVAQKSWRERPNLVRGDFQQGSGNAPAGWATHWQAGDVGGPEPLGTTIRWIAEGGSAATGNTSNRVIRFTFGAGIGDGTGVAYYSHPFEVQEGALYRFQCRWRSNGPKGIVFVKCYDEVDTKYRSGTERPAVSPGGPADYIPEIGLIREVYRSQQNLKGPQNTWNVQTEDFTPKHTRYTPRWGRVMLYAYLGGGVVEFDDVVVKQILSASPGDQDKVRRHSLETGVTIEQMQQDRRRSRQGQQ